MDTGSVQDPKGRENSLDRGAMDLKLQAFIRGQAETLTMGTGRQEKGTDLELKQKAGGNTKVNGLMDSKEDMACEAVLLAERNMKAPGVTVFKTATEPKHMQMKVGINAS